MRISHVGKKVIGLGMTVGLESLVGLEFDVRQPYAFCRICGTVFQADLDRQSIKTEFDEFAAYEDRRNWSISHAKLHSGFEHRLVEISGLFITPEAALKLAAFGVISASDMVINEEIAQASREAKSVPLNDVES